jgi:hypothetical protein
MSSAQPPRPARSLGGGEQASLELAVPAAVLELVAERVADLLADRLSPAGPEPWAGVEDVARHLGYRDDLDAGRRRVYDLKARGLLPFREDGRRLLFRLSDVDAYLEGRGR